MGWGRGREAVKSGSQRLLRQLPAAPFDEYSGFVPGPALWPWNATLKIRVSNKFLGCLKVRQAEEGDLNTCSPNQFHRRNKIGIVGHQCNQFNRPITCDRCHVQTDTHINTFLLKRRREVGINRRDRWLMIFPDNIPSKFQHPFPNSK